MNIQQALTIPKSPIFIVIETFGSKTPFNYLSLPHSLTPLLPHSLFTFPVKRLRYLMVKIRWLGRWILLSSLLLIVFDRSHILWNRPVFCNLVLQVVKKRCMVSKVRSVLFANAIFSLLRFLQTWITSTFSSYKLLCISHLIHVCRYLSSNVSPFQEFLQNEL